DRLFKFPGQLLEIKFYIFLILEGHACSGQRLLSRPSRRGQGRGKRGLGVPVRQDISEDRCLGGTGDNRLLIPGFPGKDLRLFSPRLSFPFAPRQPAFVSNLPGYPFFPGPPGKGRRQALATLFSFPAGPSFSGLYPPSTGLVLSRPSDPARFLRDTRLFPRPSAPNRRAAAPGARRRPLLSTGLLSVLKSPAAPGPQLPESLCSHTPGGRLP